MSEDKLLTQEELVKLEERKRGLKSNQLINIYCKSLINTLLSEKLELSDDEMDCVINDLDDLRKRVNSMEWRERRYDMSIPELMVFIDSDDKTKKYSELTKAWLKEIIANGHYHLIEKCVYRIDNFIVRVYAEVPEYIFNKLDENNKARRRNLITAIRNFYDDPNTRPRDNFVKVDISKNDLKTEKNLEKLSIHVFDFIVQLL